MCCFIRRSYDRYVCRDRSDVSFVFTDFRFPLFKFTVLQTMALTDDSYDLALEFELAPSQDSYCNFKVPVNATIHGHPIVRDSKNGLYLIC
jgi:hypothetical protein